MEVWKKLTSPIRQTSGMGRWVLLSGVIIVAFFVILAVFANWIAPFGFTQNSADGVDFQSRILRRHIYQGQRL